MQSADFSEAELRGVDLDALRQESFTSKTHLNMVKAHELKKAYRRHREFRPEKTITQILAEREFVFRRAMSELADIVEKSESSGVQFTAEQIEIATKVAESKSYG